MLSLGPFPHDAITRRVLNQPDFVYAEPTIGVP